METQRASIDYAALVKGDRIDGDTAWNFFCLLKPGRVESWVSEHGSEDRAKLARLAYVLMQVRDWIDTQRRAHSLTPLVLTTSGAGINVLTDDEASRYLSDRAFAGLRQHSKNTGRLIAAVDESQLSSSAQREHENRVRTHSFVLASTQGAQSQLRRLRQAGKEPPRLG
jgi:hypothetical protein